MIVVGEDTDHGGPRHNLSVKPGRFSQETPRNKKVQINLPGFIIAMAENRELRYSLKA